MSTTIGDDEYFPSLLTGGAVSPKMSKENASLGANAHDQGDLPWVVKRGPRLTFAESLSMDKAAAAARGEPATLGDVDTDDSPFNFARSATTFVRRRKPQHSQLGLPDHDDDDDDDDVPPPPTSSLADPSGFLSEHLGAAQLDELPFRPAGVTAGLAPSGAAFFQGDEWGADRLYWVTVYGFPASAKAFVLQHFQTLGDVIHYTSGDGNWLHIRYHTRLQAEKALSLDGTTLGGALMIGVKRCLPAELDGVRQEPTSGIYFSHAARRNPGSKDLEVDPIKEEDLLLPPRRRTDICSRLLGFLFNW